MYIKGIVWQDVNCICLPQDRDTWQALENKAIKILFIKKRDEFHDHLRSCKEIAVISEDSSLCQTNTDKCFTIAWTEMTGSKGRARRCRI